MKLSVSSSLAIATIVATSSSVAAFTTPSPHGFAFRSAVQQGPKTVTSTTFLQSTMQGDAGSSQNNNASTNDVSTEVERLRLMAQKLRAEASILETERQQELIEATKQIFKKFDKNQDGEITKEELQAGLTKMLKLSKDLPTSQIEKLMARFDTSGDGKLQLDEFANVSIDRFRTTLDNIMREERQEARQAAKMAQDQLAQAKLEEAQLAILNDGEPTTKDKLLSTLPYLFPLLDSIQFGSLLLLKNQDNPIAITLAAMYALYRFIPFSGLLGFFTLSFLRENPALNKLVRFNMGQAIYLDVALFFPGLLATLLTVIGNVTGNGGALDGGLIPPQIAELGADAVFLTMVATIAYCVGSSLLGKTPDKIPIMSQAVQDRMLTKEMFDENGNFILPPDMRRGDNDSDKNDDEKR